jgi:hypothetical protein
MHATGHGRKGFGYILLEIGIVHPERGEKVVE